MLPYLSPTTIFCGRYYDFHFTIIVYCHMTAAAAKSLQSYLTLCDPIDGSPPGSPVPGILQARTLEWVAISFSNAWKWKVKVKTLSFVRLLWPRGPLLAYKSWALKLSLYGLRAQAASLLVELRSLPAGFPGGSDGKESNCNARDPGSIPGSGSSSGEGHGCPLQCSYQENSMNRGAWWTTVHGVIKSQIWLSD